MSSPSRRTSPSIRAPGMTSCMRLSVRMNVDFPQPEGPMSAVTCFGSMDSVTSSTALKEPYQALTWLASMRITASGEAAAAGDQPSGHGEEQDHDDERKRAGPGTVHGGGERRRRLAEHVEGQRRLRAGERV